MTVSLRCTMGEIQTSMRGPRAPLILIMRLKSQLARVILLHLLDALVRTQESVLGHVRRVPACGRMLAYSFGERSNVMRPGAAAHAQVADVHLERGAAELPISKRLHTNGS